MVISQLIANGLGRSKVLISVNHHPVSGLSERPGNLRTDPSGGSGDKYCMLHMAILPNPQTLGNGKSAEVWETALKFGILRRKRINFLEVG